MNKLYNLPYLTLLVAPSKSGKTHLIKHIIYQLGIKNRINYCVIFSGTASNGDYNYIDEKYIYNNVDENVIKRIIKKQMQYGRDNLEAPKCILVFDDIQHNNFDTPLFKYLASTYRHYGISCIFSVQYINRVMPTLFKENATYICIFKTGSENSIRALYGTCMMDIGTLKDAFNYINKLKKYHFVLIDRYNSEKNKYTICKAGETPNFYLEFNQNNDNINDYY